MKIYIPHHQQKHDIVICCPFCLLNYVWRHGSYERKGFHDRHGSPKILRVVQRYRCVNPDCKHCTFSVLPSGVMPYCRFFWSDLLLIHEAQSQGLSSYKIAQWFEIGTSAICRAQRMLGRLAGWAKSQYRELMNGKTAPDLRQCIDSLIRGHGGTVLRYRWFRTNYPARFCKQPPHTIRV